MLLVGGEGVNDILRAPTPATRGPLSLVKVELPGEGRVNLHLGSVSQTSRSRVAGSATVAPGNWCGKLSRRKSTRRSTDEIMACGRPNGGDGRYAASSSAPGRSWSSSIESSSSLGSPEAASLTTCYPMSQGAHPMVARNESQAGASVLLRQVSTPMVCSRRHLRQQASGSQASVTSARWEGPIVGRTRWVG